MSKTERRYLRSFLTAFHVKGENLQLKLVQLLDRNPEITQEQASQKLYGSPNSKAFIMLKGRLRERMLEVLALSINLDSNPKVREDPAGFAAIEIQKQLVYSSMMRQRGLYTLALEILQKCEKRAREAGLPEHQLQAFIAQRNIAVQRSVQEVESYAAQAWQAFQAFHTDLIANEVFDVFQAQLQEYGGSSEGAMAYLREHGDRIEQALERHYSPRAHYYHLLLLLARNQYEGKIASARTNMKELTAMLEAHPGFSSKNRLGSTYMRLAGLEFNAHRFLAGMRACEMAVSVLPKQKNNLLFASTYLVFACLYRQEYDRARNVLDSLGFYRLRKRTNTYLDLLTYLDSCRAYLIGDIRSAYELLGDVQRLFVDKDGWNISLRLYEIMLLIDREEYDLATPRLETLRKHMGRYKPEPRLEAMYRFLLQLERQSYEFDLTPAQERLLESLTTELPWEAISPEVVRFDTWIRSHLQDMPFQELFVPEVRALEAAADLAAAQDTV